MPSAIQGALVREILFALGVILVAIVISLLVVFAFNRVLKALTRATRTTLDDLFIAALGRPIFYLVLVQGLHIALSALTFLDPYKSYVTKGWLLAIIVVLAYGAQRVIGAVLTWFSQEGTIQRKAPIDEKVMPVLRRVVTMVIYATALMIILDALGIAISPLIAGLGIGGLAVALALQPTLTNFIASGYIVSEAKIGVGDRIQIESGPTGVVEDIGWRTTKIRSEQNNLIIVPNAKVADSVVTNFDVGDSTVAVTVTCGASYESDLEQVRATTLEVARATIRESPVAVKEFEPLVRFYEFGESNINFRTIFRAKDFAAQFILVDAFISRLHRRFVEEGITISYPVRKLVYPFWQNGVESEGSASSGQPLERGKSSDI